MSLSAAVIDALVAAGATAEQLAAAMKADLADGEARLIAKREKDAARQRKSRSSRNVTVTPCDSADRVPPNDIYSNPPPIPLEISNEISPPIEIDDGKTGEPPLTAEEILEAFNVAATRCGLPKAKLTPQRRRKLVPLIRQHGLEDFTEAIRALERSPFLRGENDRAWRANFDFFIQPASFQKLIEGSYDRPTH